VLAIAALHLPSATQPQFRLSVFPYCDISRLDIYCVFVVVIIDPRAASSPPLFFMGTSLPFYAPINVIAIFTTLVVEFRPRIRIQRLFVTRFSSPPPDWSRLCFAAAPLAAWGPRRLPPRGLKPPPRRHWSAREPVSGHWCVIEDFRFWRWWFPSWWLRSWLV
jgi:hypothetical protein